MYVLIKMIFWMAGVITLSIVLIFLIHQVYEYLKKAFSKPLERNIANQTKSHYEQIYNTLTASRISSPQMPITFPTEIYSKAPPHENMAHELMNFMSDLENSNGSTPQDNAIKNDIQPYEEELDGVSTL